MAADQRTAVYTNAEGEETSLNNAEKPAPAPLYGGETTFHVDAYNVDAAVVATLYDDASCDIVASVYGNSAVIDQGTYVMNADHSITFQFENVGEVVAKLDMSVGTVVLNYANPETKLGAMDVSLPLGRVEAKEETKPEPQIILSFTGGYTTFDMYDNGTYQFGFEKYGIKETGTWKFENYKFSITQSNGNVIEASLDESYNMSFEYVAEANAQIKDTFTAERGVWGPALAK